MKKINKLPITLAITFFYLCLSSISSASDITMTLRTNVKDEKVFMDGKRIENTPVDVTLSTKVKEYIFHFEKKGYHPVTISINPLTAPEILSIGMREDNREVYSVTSKNQTKKVNRIASFASRYGRILFTDDERYIVTSTIEEKSGPDQLRIYDVKNEKEICTDLTSTLNHEGNCDYVPFSFLRGNEVIGNFGILDITKCKLIKKFDYNRDDKYPKSDPNDPNKHEAFVIGGKGHELYVIKRGDRKIFDITKSEKYIDNFGSEWNIYGGYKDNFLHKEGYVVLRKEVESTNDTFIKIFDPNKKSNVLNIKRKYDDVSVVAINISKNILALKTEDAKYGYVEIINIDDGSVIKKIYTDASIFSFSKNGSKLAGTAYNPESNSKTTYVWNVSSGYVEYKFTSPNSQFAALNRDGTLIAISNWKGYIDIWSLK
ncbi:MAG TPA: hypothetical protein HPP95_12565 [Deltaproteobacteria bacterium]|nr:hypothetical protein [Deltaproteobacteria bacterium]